MRKYRYKSSFYNASGDVQGDVVMAELKNLIANEPQVVVLAMREAGFTLPLNSSSQSITQEIMLNKEDKRLIQTLSALVLLSEKYNNFFKSKVGGANLGTKVGGGFGSKIGGANLGTKVGGANLGTKVGGGFGSKIGGFFKRGTNPDGTKSTSKFGSWFKTNKSQVGQISGKLAGGLLSRKGLGGKQNQSGYDISQPQGMVNEQDGGNVNEPMSMGVKLAIGSGVLY
jgi:hypothetical protein